jgi:hypothetical protein
MGRHDIKGEIDTLNVTNPEKADCEGKTPIRAALEDCLTVAVFVAVSGLIAAGGIPSVQVIYSVALSAALVGITTWARVRNVNLGVK